MKTINFKLYKNNKIIINKKNVNVIEAYNKISFIIDKIKYTISDDLFIKETAEEIIRINFKEKKCIITLKEINNNLCLNIYNIEIEKQDNFINYKYEIETEENVTNLINIEYTKK